MTGSSFDAQPDAELGHLLRECLTAPDDAAFVSRMRDLLARRPRDDSWDVLARWVRPGLAAAAAALLAAALWLARPAASRSATLAEAIRPADAPQALFAGERPRAEVVLAGAEGP